MLRLAITYDTAKNGGSAWHSLRSCQFKKLGEVLGTRRWLVPIQETRHKAWCFAVAHTTAQTSARLACSFLYPFQRLRKRKLNGYKKTECTLCMHSAKFVVGVTGLEPMASWPPVKRATKLRHTPIEYIKFVPFLSFIRCRTLMFGSALALSVRSCVFESVRQAMYSDTTQLRLRSLLIANQTAPYPDVVFVVSPPQNLSDPDLARSALCRVVFFVA